MSLVIEALDREIEFFEDVMGKATSDEESGRADASALVYLSVKDRVHGYTNDIERIAAVEELADTLAFGTAGCDLLNDFIEVNKPHYALNYCQVVHVVKTLPNSISYDDIADSLYSMSMSCDPIHLKEILAKQA